MKKWLFQSQEYIGFLFGIISGFGVNLVTAKLTDLSIIYGFLAGITGVVGFCLYKYWVYSNDEFEFFMTHCKWEKKLFNNTQTWICKDTDEYQLVEGCIVVNKFQEPWTKIFPDNENNSSIQLFLKRNGIIVREFIWVSCDGGRVWMPIPDRRSKRNDSLNINEISYFFKRNSLKYGMLKKLGDCGSELSFERLLERAKINIE